MNMHVRRFVLIAIVTVCGVLATVPPKDRLKLGIDLSGGTILVYEVKRAAGNSDFKMDDLIASLKRRVNADGLQDIPIRKVGGNRVEVILPQNEASKVDEIKRMITDVGQLEFRILANEKHDGGPGRAVDKALAPNGLKNPPSGYKWAVLGETVTGENPEFTDTTIKDPTQAWVRNRYSEPTFVEVIGKDAAGRDTVLDVTITKNDANTLTVDTARAFRPETYDPRERPRYINIKSLKGYFKAITAYKIDYNPGRVQPDGNQNHVIREQARGKGFVERYILVKIDRYNITGDMLSYVFDTTDQKIQPAVGFHFNPAGGRKFGNLTLDHLPEEGDSFKYSLAILLDGQLMSAPQINQQIGDQGIIEGMPVRERDRLIAILRSGSLPASLNPTPLLEEKIGATLGQDTIEKGVLAIAISMLVVPIFMIIYYRFAGVVAVVALVLNMILLIGSMALFQASITLPGLAGLALTIGMAVDANVLVFERMREEAERGATMSQQIRNGFNRAWATIFDSHVCTALSGVVLYAIGTEEVKGFALTLIIGLVWNLFTAVYVSRVIFDYWYSKGWLRKLTMYKMFDRPNIDFVGPRKYFMTASVVVIGVGLLYVASRGKALLNIDFTGGTLVTIQLDPTKPEIKDRSPGERANLVREMAGKTLHDTSVEALNVGGEAAGLRYNIRTTDENNPGASTSGAGANLVQQKVLDEFGPILSHLKMEPVAEPVVLPATADLFPKGWRYTLKFNRPVEPDALVSKMTEVFRKSGVANPDREFRIERPMLQNNTAALPQDSVYLTTSVEPKAARAILEKADKALYDDPNQLFERVESFGGAVAKDTRTKAIMAIVASWLIIIAYLWFRFKSVTYGLAAVVALVHDVLITLIAVAIFRYKIDLPMIAAFLTLIGFSVNDTIVIFDRIREIKGKTPVLTTKMINDALNQTLSRTILTSLTAWLVVVIMYVFGGEALYGFSFCLVVGFLSGTYSTVYIATPILVDWMKKETVPTAKGKPSKALAEI